MKIHSLNQMESQKKNILAKLEAKYGGSERVTPGALERILRLINSLYPYFQTIKTLMTILTPSK